MTTRVKICGINSVEALDAALDCGADFVGLVFFGRSPRNVDLATARALADRARGHHAVQVVALVVDAGDALITGIRREVSPDIFQLHGHETPHRSAQIGALTGREVWKAVPVSSVADVDAAGRFATEGKSHRILFDAKPPANPAALPGGNGLSFDWRMLERLTDRSFVLAGGLTPDNVAAAIRLVAPAIVDVSSGVESSPGRKSPELIRRFIRAAKGGMGGEMGSGEW
ncbi:MAG: phosphoribosylanthranilate isomerase [Hyphomicrobium sp.]